MPADTLLTVALTLERWQQVLGLLGEVPAPARLTVPLINEIQQQCQQQLPPPQASVASSTNGPTIEPQHVPN